MKATRNIILFSFLVCGFISCVPTYYMANSGIDAIVFTKPVYRDTASVTDYVGAKFSRSLDSMYNYSNETNTFGELYWFRTHTQKYYNFSYGAFGYLGNYDVKAISSLSGPKSYFGAGISADIGVSIPIGIFNFRLAGLKGTLYFEEGDYRRFKYLAKSANLGNVSTDLLGYNISETFGVDISLSKKYSIGMNTTNGISGQITSGDRFLTTSTVLNFQTQKFTLFLQSSGNFLRDPSLFLFPGGFEMAVGLNYRL